MITVDQQVIIVNRRPRWHLPRPPHRSVTCPCPGSCATPIITLTPARYWRHDVYARRRGEHSCGATTTTADLEACDRGGRASSRVPTFHDLRHTFASTALAEGVPISEVSRWLGHKSITTTSTSTAT